MPNNSKEKIRIQHTLDTILEIEQLLGMDILENKI